MRWKAPSIRASPAPSRDCSNFGTTTAIASLSPRYGNRAARQPGPLAVSAWNSSPDMHGVRTVVPSAAAERLVAGRGRFEWRQPGRLEMDGVDQHQPGGGIEDVRRHDLLYAVPRLRGGVTPMTSPWSVKATVRTDAPGSWRIRLNAVVSRMRAQRPHGG